MTRLGNVGKLSAFDLCCREDEALNTDTRRSGGRQPPLRLWHCAKRTASRFPSRGEPAVSIQKSMHALPNPDPKPRKRGPPGVAALLGFSVTAPGWGNQLRGRTR